MEEVINELDALSKEYLELKDEKSYYMLTLCERTKTFLNIAKDAEYSREGIEKVDEIKELFFNNATFEKLGLGPVDNYFGTFKIADRYGKKIKYIVVVNPDGFKKAVPLTENERLYMFELSLKDHTIDRVNPAEVKRFFASKAYTLMEDGQKLDNMQLVASKLNDGEDMEFDEEFITAEESFEDYMFDGMIEDLEY